MYSLRFSKQAVEDLQFLKRTDLPAFNKVQKLLQELMEHPRTGLGKPELMKYSFTGLYSRRITQKHRLVYQILEAEIVVLVLSSLGHYQDK